MFNHTISVNTKNGVVNYTLSLTYKRMKTIVFRPCETQENTFNVSLPYGTRISKLEEVFMKNYKSLLRLQKRQALSLLVIRLTSLAKKRVLMT